VSRCGVLLVLVGATAACTANIEGGPWSTSGAPVGAPGATPGGGLGTGTAGGSGTAPATATPDPNQPASGQVACASMTTESVGHRVLRRLTNAELETTIRTIFSLDTAAWPGVTLPSDAGSLDGFTNNVDSLTVGPDYVQGTLDGGKKIASLISADASLSKLVSCSTVGDRACADSFVSTVGAKLYRRPLSATEKGRYLALFDKVTKNEDFHSFAYWATLAMLQSPNVIYRSEVGDADGQGHYQLSQYEIATELAYTFTAAPPTSELMGLAAAGQLSTADQLEAAARGLVFDGANIKPAFRDVVLGFSQQWLGLEGFSNIKKDATLYPAFSSDVQTSMAEETRRFFSAVVLEDKAGVASLFTAPFTFVDSTLAKYYGFGAATGTDFVRVTRPANWGLGLLGQGSVLATQANALSTSPTRRGYLIRTKLLCGVVPPPPPVVGAIPPPTAAQTTRQRYETLHTANATCKACHSMMDNIGFSLEHLDSAGRFRDTENGFPIDDSGIVAGTSTGDVKVSGAADLANALAKLPETTDCVSSYLAAYALGVNHDSAACLVSGARSELHAGGSLLDFYVRMARAQHIRSRQ